MANEHRSIALAKQGPCSRAQEQVAQPRVAERAHHQQRRFQRVDLRENDVGCIGLRGRVVKANGNVMRCEQLSALCRRALAAALVRATLTRCTSRSCARPSRTNMCMAREACTEPS
jgi:hypothetical protein